MNKRGSHVGIMASFGIFVMFLVGIYVVMDPMFRTQEDKQLLLDYLEVELIKEFSTDLTTAIISSDGGGCLEIDNADVNVTNGLNATVKDDVGNIIDSEFSVNTLKIDSSSELILWVYYSEAKFENTASVSCGSYIAHNVESVRTDEKIFEQKIKEGISDFENLEQKLNIPLGSEFSFAFEYENGTRKGAGEKNTSVNIYAKEIPIQYIDKNANDLAGKLIIKVW